MGVQSFMDKDYSIKEDKGLTMTRIPFSIFYSGGKGL